MTLLDKALLTEEDKEREGKNMPAIKGKTDGL